MQMYFMLKTNHVGTSLFQIILIAVNFGAKLSNMVVINKSEHVPVSWNRQ